MKEQSEEAVTLNVPGKPKPRASLPRFSNEMTKNLHNRHFQNLSYSSSEDDYSTTPSRSPTPEWNYKINHCPACEEVEFYKNPQNRRMSDFYETEEDYDSEFEDDYDSESEEENKNKSNDESKLKAETKLIAENKLKVENKVEKSPNQSKNSQRSVVKEESFEISYVKVFFLIAIVGAIAFAFIQNFRDNPLENREMVNKEEIRKFVKEEIRQLKEEFRNQKRNIWREIYSGIMEVISSPTKPSIFLLFADKNDPMNCLAQTIGEVSRKALGSEKSLILNPIQLNNTTGEVIETLRFIIPQRKTVIFWDLLSINDEALKAFHYLCDREDPLIEEAIYIITIKTTGYINSGNPLEFIESQLMSNFSGRIDEDSILPLIIRITDGVIIPVEPETNIQCKFENVLNY